MVSFQSIDINGTACNFQYEIEEGDILHEDEITFKVYEMDAKPMEWFTYTFLILDGTTAKGISMSNNNLVQFSKKGIPERIIEIACYYLQHNIISSPIDHPMPGDFLVGPSKKAWERLIQENQHAYRDYENDHFQLDFVG